MAKRSTTPSTGGAAPSRGRFANSGNGPSFVPIDIGHDSHVALIEPDTAFWALVPKAELADSLTGPLLASYRRKADQFAKEMKMLRFGLKPSAVYFNPTERCNLNCTYCYIPDTMRRSGQHMPADKLMKALGILKDHFARAFPQSVRGQEAPGTRGRDARATAMRPQIVFHGAEPMLNREAMFAGIDAFKDDFRFGVQTNATLLDDSAVAFLAERRVSIGISLDAPTAAIANRTRKTWDGQGVYGDVLKAMDRLQGYNGWSVICTVSSANLRQLSQLVEFFHDRRVPTCLMNILRCTLEPSRAIKPDDASAAKHFLAALDRSYELFQETGRRLPIANFSNILLAIVAPTARRLMCDISPCGGGRCFFALAPSGDMFPCSEFIGLDEFRGGNLFTDKVETVLASEAFTKVTGRKVEDIDPCNQCAIRHFCGSPCPAEAHEMNGGMHKTGAFCEFYEEQVRYAFRVIADGKLDGYLWPNWDKGLKDTFTAM